MKYYMCQKCRTQVAVLKQRCDSLTCCGEKMRELDPETAEGAGEKHIPVVTMEGRTAAVKVGEVPHPMLEEHFIEWIAAETKKNYYQKNLAPGEAPEASFVLEEGEEVLAAYAYCNLHSLWKK